MAGGSEHIVRQLFAGIERGSPEDVLRTLAEDVEWTPTIWSSGATLHGRDDVRMWLAQFGRRIEHLRIDVAALERHADRVLVLGTVFDTRDRGAFATRVGWVFELSDGLIRRARSHESWDLARKAL